MNAQVSIASVFWPNKLKAFRWAATLGLCTWLLVQTMNVVAEDADEAMLQALYLGDNRAAAALLEQGADPNLYSGSTPILTIALAIGNRELFDLLLDRGADPTQPDRISGITTIDWVIGDPSLHWPERFNDYVGQDPAQDALLLQRLISSTRIDLVEVFMDRLPRDAINMILPMGTRPLEAALYTNQEIFLELLKHAKADQLRGSELMSSPLAVLVARQGSATAMRALIDQGARVDLGAKDPLGTTALMVAVQNGNHELAELLLGAMSADQVDAVNWLGLSARDLALFDGDPAMIALWGD